MGGGGPASAQRDPANAGAATASRVSTDGLAALPHALDQLQAGKLPLTSTAHRAGLLGQIKDYPSVVVEALQQGATVALASIAVPERPPASNQLAELLGLAVSIALAGAAGSAAVWLSSKVVARAAATATDAAKLAVRVEEKFVEDSFKDAVKKGAQFKATRSTQDLDDLKAAFGLELGAQILAAHWNIVSQWSELNDRLSTLSDDQLASLKERLDSAMREKPPADLVSNIANQVVVAWSNFLAQSHLGAMGSWDFWDQSANGSPGAVRTPGVAAPPRDAAAAAELTAGNVDPVRATSVLDTPYDHTPGTLEIVITPYGGAGKLRLEGVGPKVRKRIRQLGHVRDAKMNKLVRVYAGGLDRSASFVITADGYVRAGGLGAFTRVVLPRRDSPWDQQRADQACWDGLHEGRESAECHPAREANQEELAQLVEIAQSQP